MGTEGSITGTRLTRTEFHAAAVRAWKRQDATAIAQQTAAPHQLSNAIIEQLGQATPLAASSLPARCLLAVPEMMEI